MKRWLKRISIVLVMLCCLGIGLGLWAFKKTQDIPEFYARAEESIPENTQQAVINVEQEVEALQQNVTQAGSWSAIFSDGEINAWLMQELPTKFPRLLRKGVKDPRLIIEDGKLMIAAKYKDKRFDTVVSFQIRPELTEQPNVIALHVSKLRAGSLPLPIDQFLQKITKEAARGDLSIEWDLTDEGPVAIVSVPSEHPKYAVSPVIVESVILREGELEVAGHTGPDARESYQPRGSTHRLASAPSQTTDSTQHSTSDAKTDASLLR